MAALFSLAPMLARGHSKFAALSTANIKSSTIISGGEIEMISEEGHTEMVPTGVLKERATDLVKPFLMVGGTISSRQNFARCSAEMCQRGSHWCPDERV